MPRPGRSLAIAVASLALAGCGSTVNGVPNQQSLANGLSDGLSTAGGTTAETGVGSAAANDGATLPASTVSTGATTTQGTDAATSPGTSSSGVTSPSVTPTKPIVIGITYSKDAGAGLAAIGASGAGTLGDQLAYAKIVVDDANVHGGFHGRKIQPVYFGYDPNPGAPSIPQQDQTACATFLDDNHVELAMVNLAGESLITCLQKRKIPMVAEGNIAGLSATFYKQNPSLFEFGAFNLDRRAGEQVRALKRQGYFTGWNTSKGAAGNAPVKVGVIAYDSPSWVDATKNSLVPALAAAGVSKPEVVFVATHDSYSNLTAMQSQIQAAVLNFKAHGVTHVIISDNNGVSTLFFMTNASNQGYRPRYGVNSGNNMELMSRLADKSQLEGAIGIGWNPLMDLGKANEGGHYANAGRKACDALMSAHGQSGSGYNEGFALAACSTMTVAKSRYDTLQTLSSGAFLQAMAQLGGSYAPLITPAAYLSATRHDGLGGIRDYKFDSGCKCMVYASKVVLLSR